MLLKHGAIVGTAFLENEEICREIWRSRISAELTSHSCLNMKLTLPKICLRYFGGKASFMSLFVMIEVRRFVFYHSVRRQLKAC